MRRGAFRSGKEHFDLHGRLEGRLGGFASGSGRPIFFCHIPKTAGTSLRMALEQVFAPHAILPDAYMMARHGGRYPPLSVFRPSLAASPDSVRLMRGHYPLAARELLRQPLTVTVLRDPVQRSISELRHLMSIGILDRAAIVRSLEAGILPAMSNGQVHFLSAKADAELQWEDPFQADPGGAPDEADLEQALRALETVDLLGLVEDMPAFSTRLRAISGVEIPQARTNVGTEKLALDAGHIETIRRHNELDAALYERARELLAKPA